MLLLPLFVRKCWLSYGLAVFILLFPLPLGLAADLTVTTTTDVVNGDVYSPQALKANPGPDGISLREAVLAVNNAVGPHTITFVATLAGQTINITSPLFITRDGITLTGLSTPDGQPNITLDAVNITTGLCCNTLLFVYASDFTLTRLRITRVQNHALRIMAGQILYPPSAPSEVRNIRIEDNVFDNTGLEDYPLGDGDAIRIWMDPVAADVSITNVSILQNTFRHFQGKGVSGNGVIIVPSGTNCVIRDVVIQDNIFVDTKFPVEVGVSIGSRNRVVGTRIFGNTFTNGVVPVFIGVVAGDRSASGSVIEDTVIRGNVFLGTLDSISIVGGHTNGGATNATGNSIINTQIVNNLILTGRGIHIVGGGPGGSGNRVDGVEVINNTIITHPLAGVRADKNREDGTENSVTGVSVLNTIFQKREPGPEDVIAGEITPDQVRFSIISTPGFVGVNGNFSADPKFVNPNFVNPEEGDFHLQPGSPAIDAGTSDSAPSTDLECRTRFDDPSTPNTGEGAIRYYDIGAFEYGSPPTVRLTLTNEGTGNGTVAANPTGNDCGADNSLIYNIGTMVTLTPIPALGSVFEDWGGGPDCSDGVVTMTSNRTCIATFNVQTFYPINLLNPSDGEEFNACSIHHLTLFQWESPERFKSIEVQFSKDNFSTITVKVKVKPGVNQLLMKSGIWKKILLLPGTVGGTLYWRVVGTKADKTKIYSDVFSLFIEAAEAVGNPQILPTNRTVPPLPTLTWENNCNKKFKVWFYNDHDFYIDPKKKGVKKKNLSFNILHPNDNDGLFEKALTYGQWNSIRKLVDDGSDSNIYWHVESWDVVKRYNRTQQMSFVLNE